MEDTKIKERMDRAHRKATQDLIAYMDSLSINGMDRKAAREFYCGALRQEIFRSESGEKENDDHLMHLLVPALLSEYQSKELDSYVEEAILEYHRTQMNRKILTTSAIAILATKFKMKDIQNYTVQATSENLVSIVWHRRYTDVSFETDLESLTKKIQGAQKMKELFK